MSEHFDIDETLTVACDRCGKVAGGWDETSRWSRLTDVDEYGLECDECEGWEDEPAGWG